MKNRKKYLILIAISLISALLIVAMLLFLRQTSLNKINEERKQQLREITLQISDTFNDALSFQRACLRSAVNLFTGQTYATQTDLIKAVGQISDTFLSEESEDEADRIFFLLDESGKCYDRNGMNGIWGNFDQTVSMSDGACSTFIADAVNYDGIYWATVQKLEQPVITADGTVTIRYLVLMKTVEAMSRYYSSQAYGNANDVYILKENGTRWYNNVSSEDIISSLNIYKELQENPGRYDGSFDDVLTDLAETGAACGNYEKDGVEYCYSLVRLQEEQCVLLFLLPISAVASSTIAMVRIMMQAFLIIGLVMLALALAFLFAALRFMNQRRLVALKEQNLRQSQEANERLTAVNEALIKAKRDAESALDIARSANRAKSSFLSNMSHDIRTPLNAIIGFLTLLERDADDPAQVRLYIGKIKASSQHLLNLINDILDMSRIESGKTTLRIQTVPINTLMENAQNVIMTQAHGKKLNFTVDVADTAELMIRCDKLRLSQILMNLLSNAVKYTPEGGNIHLSVERIENPSSKMVTLRFVVSDDGIGMSSEFQKRVFEPFEREQESTTSGIQGTGLGMAITKNLVDLMGGIIFVDSTPGAGSTFTMELTFPLAEGEGAEPLNAADTVTPAHGHKTDIAAVDRNILSGRHFLVAEDNDINAEIIRELLAMEGASCEIAKNGKEALALFEEAEPDAFDAIFMDIQMPVMDGYEATRQIRTCGRPDAMRIPIAAMTANAFAEDVQRAFQTGMNAHIPKPVDMEKIRKFIAEELGRKDEKQA